MILKKIGHQGLIRPHPGAIYMYISIIFKQRKWPKGLSAPALELNTIIFKHVYWYMQLISGERLQDHWSSGFTSLGFMLMAEKIKYSQINDSGRFQTVMHIA